MVTRTTVLVMTESPGHIAPSEGLLLEQAVARWEDDLRRAHEQMDELAGVATKIANRIALARALLSDTPTLPAAPSQALPVAPDAPPPQRNALQRKGTWAFALRRWIYSAPAGMTSAELRAAVDTDPIYSARLAESEKGYYHALSRLRAAGVIVQHKGRHYSPAAYKDHLDRVAAGEATDEPVTAYSHSPMGEAILDIVASSPGIKGAEIVRRLRSDPEFDAALTPHKTGAFNVIARLARRRLLQRDGGHCSPGPEMPPRDPASKWLMVNAMADRPSAIQERGRLI